MGVNSGTEWRLGNVSLHVPTRNRYDAGRLWSVWDMLELKAGGFYQAATNLASTSAWVSATKFAGREGLFHPDQLLDDHDREFLRSRLRALADQLSNVGARVTILAVEDAERVLSLSTATWGTAQSRIDEINNTIRH
jgi:hypothetical protein